MESYYVDHINDELECDESANLEDGMMDELDEDDVENDNIFKRVHSDRLLDEIEIDINDSMDPNQSLDALQEEKEQTPKHVAFDYIPPKRTKNESVAEIRDLNVILTEK